MVEYADFGWGNCSVGIVQGLYRLTTCSLQGIRKDSLQKLLVAVTADRFQQDAREVLQRTGWKELVTFDSSHGKGERCTLWVNAPLEIDPTWHSVGVVTNKKGVRNAHRGNKV